MLKVVENVFLRRAYAFQQLKKERKERIALPHCIMEMQILQIKV